MSIEIICLFLKQYLDNQQFEDLFYNELSDFEKTIDTKLFFKILETKFNSKESVISLKSALREYVEKFYQDIFNEINDAYIEKISDSDRCDAVTNIFRRRYIKEKEIHIDCESISSKYELIHAIKCSLNFPACCGNNWDAINDLIYDIILPEVLIFKNWLNVEKAIPDDSKKLKKIFSSVNSDRCIIIFS